MTRPILFKEWKVTHAPGYPDPASFDNGQRARTFQANHGGIVWVRETTSWQQCPIEVKI